MKGKKMSKAFFKNMLSRKHYAGFTFVEILASMLFMAIVIPVAVQGITIASRAGVAAERKRIAAELADEKITEFILDDSWREGEQEGTFENLGAQIESGYRWTLATTAWEEDTMRLITVTVYYTVQQKELSVQLSTLAPEEEESEE